MDKKIKTDWEKMIHRWQIVLIIMLPLLFGLVFWLVVRPGHLRP
jgi:hypothetical protein